MLYVRDNVYQFAMGVPVKTHRYFDGSDTRGFMVGHVLGFALNSQSEIIIRVQWADGEVGTMHPAHLELLVKREN